MGTGIFDLANYALNPYGIAPAAVGCLSAFLGLYVLVRERFSIVSIAFSGMTGTGAVWLLSYLGMYCAKTPGLALVWARIENVGVVFIPSMVYLFTLAVTNRLQPGRAWAVTNVLVSSGFAFLVLFTDLFVSGVRGFFWGQYPVYGPLSLPFMPFFFTLLMVSLRHCWRGYKTAPSEIHRRRMRSFLTAFGIAYLGSVDYLGAYGVPVYPIGYLPVFIFFLIAARTVWKYQLVDITPAFAANQILRTMSDGLLVLDRDGIIRVANQAACRMFELRESEMAGKPVWAMHGGLFSREKLQIALRTRVVHAYEAPLETRDGRRLILEVCTAGIRDWKRQPTAVVCVIRDVTQRRREAEELKQAHDALKRSMEELKSAQLSFIQAAKMESIGRLAAGVAHEVKNPLAVVLQGLDYLGQSLPSGNAELDMVLAQSKEAVLRADRVVRGLLDYSSMRDLELRGQNLNRIMEKALSMVKHEMDRCGVQVCKELPEALPPVLLDANKIEQLFVNLFMNAVQAMPSGKGVLTLRTRAVPLHGDGDRSDVAVVAEVEDTGSGIPDELLPRIFEPFFTTKPSGTGTGLGLAVCKNIMEMHGGTIEMQNRMGGSGVRVVLNFKAEAGP